MPGSSRFVIELVQPSGSNREQTLRDVHVNLARLAHVSQEALKQVELAVQKQQHRLDQVDARLSRIVITKQRQQVHEVATLQQPSSSAGETEQHLFETYPIVRIGHGQVDLEMREPLPTLGGVTSREPVIPQAAVDDLRLRIARERDHKLAWRSQQQQEGESSALLTTVTRSHEDEEEEDLGGLGRAPHSLQRQQLLPSSSSLSPAAAVQASSSPTPAVTMATHELSFHEHLQHHRQLHPQQQLTPDSLGLPADLSAVFSSSSSSFPSISTAQQQQQQPVALPPPLAVVVSQETTAPPPLPPAKSAAAPPPPTRSSSSSALPADFLSAIRQGKSLQPVAASTAPAIAAVTAAPATAKPKTLAEEMRDKLQRRQALLSGERDEEEQRADRQQRKRGYNDTDRDDARSTMSIGPPPPPPPMRGAQLRRSLVQPQPPVAAAPAPLSSVGMSFDRVFEREMSKKDLFAAGRDEEQEEDEEDEDEEWGRRS